ncbi:MAG: heat-shock protein [Bacteroidetes bacterium CG12_big_fil_rev_8_21_14_0_65_60_17]|nr:MAG: heat-shock protein [Bacteroidetes bacterium CG12_big_fil_rev_8_21_14_0_65_60_17]
MTQLVRFSPRHDMNRLQRDFDRLFGTFFPGFDEDADQNVSWTPHLDVLETEDAYVLEMDVPGVSRDDIQINLQDGVLTVSGERASREVSENDNVVRVERHAGRFFRSFRLPKKINEQKIEARHENGVLMVTLPKVEESKPRKIKVS